MRKRHATVSSFLRLMQNEMRTQQATMEATSYGARRFRALSLQIFVCLMKVAQSGYSAQPSGISISVVILVPRAYVSIDRAANICPKSESESSLFLTVEIRIVTFIAIVANERDIITVSIVNENKQKPNAIGSASVSYCSIYNAFNSAS